MKKFITYVLSALLLISTSGVTVIAVNTSADKSAAMIELQEIFKIYDEDDYTEENWMLMQEAYSNGLFAIEGASTSDEVYSRLNYAAESMIEIPHKRQLVTVCISVEKLIVEQDFIIEPQYVKAEKYERASEVLTKLLEDKYDIRDPYIISGKIEDDFVLDGVYIGETVYADDETEIDTPSYLRSYIGDYLDVPFDKTYLKSGDYTSGSSFVYSVNNTFPNVNASAIPVVQDDVIRWQFSLYGNGADLGADTYKSETPVISGSDKSELFWKLAELYADDIELLLSDEANLQYYTSAMKAVVVPNVSQKAVDKALKKLNSIKPVTEVPEEEAPDENTSDDAETIPDIEDEPTDSEGDTSTEDIVPVIFSDLDDIHYAKEAIDFFASQGILTGRPDGTFGIDDDITRGELATILSRYDGYTQVTELPFADVSPEDWYACGVSYCYSNGITNGQTTEIFNPDAPITRQELATMLFRFAQYKEITLTASEVDAFADAEEIADFAKEAVQALQQASIVNGREDNIFSPIDNATRAETAKMIYNLIKKLSVA